MLCMWATHPNKALATATITGVTVDIVPTYPSVITITDILV